MYELNKNVGSRQVNTLKKKKNYKIINYTRKI